MLWKNLTCAEFPDAVARSKGVCVIPIGATEKHGQHLPVGTDTIVVGRIAEEAAEEEEVVVFRPFAFGQLLGLQHFDGSVCLSTRLMMDYLTELCREIARSGFKKILLLNGHGGNVAYLNYFCQSTREEKKDYVVVTGKCWPIRPQEILKAIGGRGRKFFPQLTDEDIATLEAFTAQKMETGHGCFQETLSALGVKPDMVRLDLMNSEDGCSTHRFDHVEKAGLYNPYNWLGNQPNSLQATYHPGANERLGAASRKLMIEKTVKLYRALKDDEEYLKINDEWNSSW